VGTEVTATRIKAALIVYGALTLVAVGWGVLRGNVDLYHHPAAWLHLPLVVRFFGGGVGGLLVGLLVTSATRASVRRFDWAKQLHVEFRHIFGPLRTREVLAFAVLSSVAEELFFRGALQGSLGICASSIIFGLLHIGPTRRFVPWTAMAIVMGFVLGVLFRLTGDLTAPIAAHLTINFINLQYISDYDPLPRAHGRWPAEKVPIRT
jgi:CAAX protease family protein